MPRTSVTIAIPTFNGWTLLERYLPAVLRAARAHGSAEVLVVDDGSTDGSPQRIQASFTTVRLISRPSHQGFIHAVNAAVAAASGRAVILLNSDVEVDEGFIAPLVRGLDDATFAVCARSLTDQGHNEGPSLALFEEGELSVLQPGVEAPDERHELRLTTFHASAGFSAFDRERFLQLGGLDPLFRPFYWEDVDLCFRAWKRGWRVIYEPQSLVWHHAHGTISRFYSTEQTRRIYERNRHLFVLKNISAREYLVPYLRRLEQDLFGRPGNRQQALRVQGALEALGQARALAARRACSPDETVYSDSDVLRLSANQPC